MTVRKVWVRRPGQSATLVTFQEEDLVDDVRDVILKKYANSLGRSFDSPDVTMRLIPRYSTPRASPGAERGLGPEEHLARILDVHYPGGQSVDEALIIDVPRRTPRPSPRNLSHLQFYPADDTRPGAGGEYFPPMPAMPSPRQPSGSVSSLAGSLAPNAHAVVALSSNQVHPLPSPGSTRPRHNARPRPPARTGTASPTLVAGIPSVSNDTPSHHIPPAPILPHLPADVTHPAQVPQTHAPAAIPLAKTVKKNRRNGVEYPSISTGSIECTVPPINVLLVEDNIINLKLLEAFMKRLKVRWQTAMNGREAVNKWRKGGFHLVLMDIQLPVMNGLDATKEIRRLERINHISVLSSSSSSPSSLLNSARNGSSSQQQKRGGGGVGLDIQQEEEVTSKGEEDRLENIQVFKSPVIIVALTASSLQSDRHEALAAGCNDFLTKPVNYVWLERKVMEWGCMQALIDFDGWRKWKDYGGMTTTTTTTTITSTNVPKVHSSVVSNNNNNNPVGGGVPPSLLPPVLTNPSVLGNGPNAAANTGTGTREDAIVSGSSGVGVNGEVSTNGAGGPANPGGLTTMDGTSNHGGGHAIIVAGA